MLFSRFSDQSRDILVHAQQEARNMGHNFVGTEQILLGMMAQGDNESAAALSQMNIRLENTRQEVQQIIGVGSGFTEANIPYTPRTKRVFELALKEADQRGDETIEASHLLLGIMREGEGVAAAVVRKLADPSQDILKTLNTILFDSE